MNFDKLTKLIDEQPKNVIPGLDVMVYHHGKEVYRHMTGTCDYLLQKPVSEDTLYWIYSMTKPITMTAMMQCIEKGLIGLDDPVGDYLPEYKNMTVRQSDGSVRPAKNVMRVRHIMSMTAGMSYNKLSPALLEAKRDMAASTNTLVRAMAAEPLLYEPGTSYKYSLGHDVSAAVMEVATGMKFGEYLKKNIFDPLGMTTATFRETPDIRKRLAAHFMLDPESETITPKDFQNPYCLLDTYESGGAGLICSTADYGKFVAAMSTAFSSEKPLLSKASIDLMRTPVIPDEVAEQHFAKYALGYSYGLGVRTMKYPERHGAKSPVGEFGWDGAAGSHGLIDPDNEIGLVYMMQVGKCKHSYFTLFPTMRDMVYEILSEENR